MATPNNTFITYDLTEEEEHVSNLLNYEQRCKLQNLYMQTLVLKGNLTLDTTNVNEYIQDEACYNGQLQLLRTLLDKDEELRAEPLQS
jgi:hypothetical protein